jgi:hypothetical protein
MAEFVTDDTRAIIPEFTADAEKDIVCEVERPGFFDPYVSMDIGFIDLTAVLFGYWDFELGILVIEDEYVLNKMTTDQLARGIRAKEERLWNGKKPYMRISDTDLIVIGDLTVLHDLNFISTQKDNKEAAINQVRLLVNDRRIKINPRCRVLISHLRHGVWNKNRTRFDRSADHGHFDCVDALAYMIRNLDRSHNPFPSQYAGLDSFSHMIFGGNERKSYEQALIDMFSGRRFRDTN